MSRYNFKLIPGTNYIVALLLLIIGDEEKTFFTFVQIMFDMNWREVFKNETPKLMNLLKTFKRKLEKNLPDLFEYFLEKEVIIILLLNRFILGRYFPKYLSQHSFI